MRSGDIVCPPPRREVHAPTLPVPAYSCDTHAHVLGPAARFPYAEERIYTPPDSTEKDYLALLHALGVQRAVLVQPSVYATDNRALLEALKNKGAGMRGVAVVEPSIGFATLRAMHDAGVRGVRLNLVDRREGRNLVPADDIRALAKKLAPLGWHIELLVNLDEAVGLAALLADLPVPLVVGHFGYPKMGPGAWAATDSLGAFLALLAEGRLWVKFTGPYRISQAADIPYDDVTPLALRLVEVNPDRLLWGTDWPHVMMKKPMPNDGDLADLVARWIPQASQRERILVDNPAALYGFDKTERLSKANS